MTDEEQKQKSLTNDDSKEEEKNSESTDPLDVKRRAWIVKLEKLEN